MTALAMAQSPVFRSDMRAVEVTLVATSRDGALVTDLRRDELRIFDNNREQNIASFEKMDGAKGSGPADLADAHVTPASRRLSIIVIDALNTSWCSRDYGREAVSQVLGKLPQEDTDQIAIFALGDELQLLHDFSNDKASLQEAVDDYDEEPPIIGVDQDDPYVPFGCPRMTPATPKGPVAAFNQEERVSRTLDTFLKIAARMKSVRGEKSLLWVSEAFPPPPSHRGMERAVSELAAAKVKLFPVDPAGLRGSQVGTMEELTEPTGGRVFSGSNDIAALLQGAMDDSRRGYILTFSPAEYRADGSFHELRLKTSRKGVELFYRPSYLAQ